MNDPIGLTPHDLFNIILAVCGAIITIAAASGIIINFIKRFKEPEYNQNARISNIESRLEKIDRALYIDKQRLDRIEYGTSYQIEALLALLEHAINPNDLTNVKAAKKNIERYLLDKGSITFNDEDIKQKK